MRLKKDRLVPFAKRAGIGLAISAGLFVVVALLPGKLEGVYFQGITCMCDSIHFTDYRHGKMILYGTSHPPAEVLCRYDTDADNVSTIYWLPSQEGEPEKVIAQAYPHLLVTQFVYAEDGTSEWAFKRPRIGKVAEAMEEQEIILRKIAHDRSAVTTTYHDPSLNPIRSETKLSKKAAKSVGAAAQ